MVVCLRNCIELVKKGRLELNNLEQIVRINLIELILNTQIAGFHAIVC